MLATPLAKKSHNRWLYADYSGKLMPSEYSHASQAKGRNMEKATTAELVLLQPQLTNKV